MQRLRKETKRPLWMQMAARLIVWVALALLVFLILGIVFDYITGLSPLGLLFGVVAGTMIALVIVLRIIQNRLMILSPPVEPEDVKENS